MECEVKNENEKARLRRLEPWLAVPCHGELCWQSTEGTQGTPWWGLRKVWDGLRWHFSWSSFGPISSSRLTRTLGQGPTHPHGGSLHPRVCGTHRPILSPAGRSSTRRLLDMLLPASPSCLAASVSQVNISLPVSVGSISNSTNPHILARKVWLTLDSLHCSTPYMESITKSHPIFFLTTWVFR